MVDIRLPDGDKTLIARGDYVRESAQVDKSGESLKALSQLRGYHFGDPLTYYDCFNPFGSVTPQIEDDIVFNPSVDNQTQFNRSSKTRTGTGLSGFVWSHPEIPNTTVTETWQEQTRNEWTLKQAVQSICELLNPNETHIKRPGSTDLTKLDDAPPLRAVRIALGTRLPQALDTLLIPLGYNWYVDYTETQPWIEFFKIGDGEKKELHMQAVGETLDLNESNLNQWSVENSIGDSFNEVLAYGEFEEAECTFKLYPAWAATHDAVSATDLAKDGAGYAGKETVWRLWIANEAGDLDPATSRLGQTPTVPDLRSIFVKAIPHRRVLGEPLTYLSGTPGASGQERQRQPIVVEWSDDGGATWNPLLEDWTIKLCPDQIGVLFDSKAIPQELYTAGSSARVRVTGTVFGDSRISYRAEKEEWAANGRTVVQVVTRPDKFQKRFRVSSGDFASVLSGTADTRDDSTAIQDFAEKLRDQNHYAEVDCEFRLPGWHLEYKIGDLITKINGREINLDSAPDTAPSNRYPQIVERRFEMGEGGPSTVLIVDRGVSQA
jgi:hypothetical protein